MKYDHYVILCKTNMKLFHISNTSLNVWDELSIEGKSMSLISFKVYIKQCLNMYRHYSIT